MATVTRAMVPGTKAGRTTMTIVGTIAAVIGIDTIPEEDSRHPGRSAVAVSREEVAVAVGIGIIEMVAIVVITAIDAMMIEIVGAMTTGDEESFFSSFFVLRLFAFMGVPPISMFPSKSFHVYA